MNTESLFPGMLIYKVELKFKDRLVLVCSLKMGCGWDEEVSSPSTSYKKKRPQVQLTVAPSKFSAG